MPTQVIKQCEEKMQKSVESVKKEFAMVRTGKANPNILNNVMVEYWGSATPLYQIASISAPDPQTITIKPDNQVKMCGVLNFS